MMKFPLILRSSPSMPGCALTHDLYLRAEVQRDVEDGLANLAIEGGKPIVTVGSSEQEVVTIEFEDESKLDEVLALLPSALARQGALS